MGEVAGGHLRGRMTGAIGRILAVTMLVLGALLTLWAPPAGAQTGSYFRLTVVAMLESDLENGRCDFNTSRDASPLVAEIGDTIVLCSFVFNQVDAVAGAGADALNSRLIDDSGTPNDSTDDVTIQLDTVDAGVTSLLQRSITLSAPGQLLITSRAEASNSLNGDDGSNTASVTVNVAGVVPTTTTSTTVATTTVAPITTSTSTTSTTVQSTTTTDVTVAGAVVNNEAQLPFTGAEDEMTSIWATALIAAGLALLVGTRRRFTRQA